MSFSFIKMRANTGCLLTCYNVCLVVSNIPFNILYACKMVYNICKMVSNIHMYNILSKTIWKLTRIAPGYSHAMWCNNQCLLSWTSLQKMVYNIRKMVSNIHMYNILSKTIWKLTRIAPGYSHVMWCNTDVEPTSGNSNESSEMLSNYRGGTTASARVLYKRLKFWKVISGAVGKYTNLRSRGRS